MNFYSSVTFPASAVCINIFSNEFATLETIDPLTLQARIWSLLETDNASGILLRQQVEAQLKQDAIIVRDLKHFNSDYWLDKNPSSTPEKWVLKSGLVGIFKKYSFFERMGNFFEKLYNKFNSPGAEIAAYELDKLIGFNIVPMTVYRNEGRVHGSLQILVDAHSYGELNNEGRIKIFIFDYLIDNWDRRIYGKYDQEGSYYPSKTDQSNVGRPIKIDFNNNVLLDINGRPFAIDNGVGFSLPRWARYWRREGYASEPFQFQVRYKKIIPEIPDDLRRQIADIDIRNVELVMKDYLPKKALDRLIARIREVQEDLNTTAIP